MIKKPLTERGRAGEPAGAVTSSVYRGLRVAFAILVLSVFWSTVAPAAATNAAAAKALARTNLALALRPGAKTNAPAAGAKTATPGTAPVAGKGAGSAQTATNAVVAGPMARARARVTEVLANWRASRAFYPVLVVVLFGAGVGVFYAVKVRSQAARLAQGAPTTALARAPKGTGRRTALHSCNVLDAGEGGRLWQFDARGGGFSVNREEASSAGGALPAGLVAKDWTTLWQPKLNVAWLPPEQVFLRVVQLPRSDFSETVAMVELQLEKLSPMPVAQVVWSLQILPHMEGDLETVIVLIAAREAVEAFLGQLESRGYLADRLELPLLDQLQATPVNEDGAWIYPEATGGKNGAVVAWWFKGVLQNLDFLAVSATNRAASLVEQLLQMAWAGELEGWVTSAPRWHLVAEGAVATEWESALRAGLEHPVPVFEPVPRAQLAALTARRAAHAEAQANLLPPEVSARYRQQFQDRLWMRGLGAVLGLYLIGVLIYGVAVGFFTLRTMSVDNRVAEKGGAYTNAMLLKARYGVLKDREDLKNAALDCYLKVAELLPAEATLDGLNFSDGKKLALQGTAPSDKVPQLYEFEAAIRKAEVRGQPFFDPAKSENLVYHTAGPGNPSVSWTLMLQLKRVEVR